MNRICVIICSYNPRLDVLSQCANHLKSQTLSHETWDLLIIDNGSTQITDYKSIFNFHPNLTITSENKPGQINARLKGIRESSHEILVFVDDDNLLAPDYLERVLEIHEKHPNIGVYGAAKIEPIFESEFDPRLQLWINHLGLPSYPETRWSNKATLSFQPIGAGIVVQRKVALQYLQDFNQCKYRQFLGRFGSLLTGGDDNEFSWSSESVGLGIGVFQELNLKHFIKKDRLTKEYLSKLLHGIGFSSAILKQIHPEFSVKEYGIPKWSFLIQRFFTEKVSFPYRLAFLGEGLIKKITFNRMDEIKKLMYMSEKEGYELGVKHLQEINS